MLVFNGISKHGNLTVLDCQLKITGSSHIVLPFSILAQQPCEVGQVERLKITQESFHA